MGLVYNKILQLSTLQKIYAGLAILGFISVGLYFHGRYADRIIQAWQASN